jgi:hypothetical protein
MIQTVIVVILVVISAAYIFIRMKNTAKGCGPGNCSGCPFSDSCGEDNKKSRP